VQSKVGTKTGEGHSDPVADAFNPVAAVSILLQKMSGVKGKRVEG
jgi:hypothetical protein